MELSDAKALAADPASVVGYSEPEMAILDLCHAAMWAALGQQTQLSRTGFCVVFIPPLRAGRADLSGDPKRALAQMAHAHLDVQGVTQAQWDGYHAWRSKQDDDKAVQQARILVSRKFGHFVRMSAGLQVHEPHVSVNLINGLGECEDFANVRCRDVWEPETRNLIGSLGAMCSYPDYDAIDVEIARMRHEHPRYASVPVIDNHRKG